MLQRRTVDKQPFFNCEFANGKDTFQIGWQDMFTAYHTHLDFGSPVGLSAPSIRPLGIDSLKVAV